MFGLARCEASFIAPETILVERNSAGTRCRPGRTLSQLAKSLETRRPLLAGDAAPDLRRERGAAMPVLLPEFTRGNSVPPRHHCIAGHG